MNLPRPLVIFLAFCGGAAIFATPLVLGAIALGARGPAASASPSAPVAASASAGASSDEVLGTITIHAVDLAFEPTTIEVEQAGRYTVSFMNDGALAHDITFADGTKIPATAGKTVSGEVVIPAAGLTFICSVPGHEAAGMKGTVTVAGAQASGSPAPSGVSAGHARAEPVGTGLRPARSGGAGPCERHGPRHRAEDERAADDRRARL